MSYATCLRWITAAAVLAVTLVASTPVRGNAPPLSLNVHPPHAVLDGPRSGCQVLVTGKYSDGSLRDLTHAAEFHTVQGDKLVALDGPGWIRAIRDGEAVIEVRYRSQTARITVRVRNAAKVRPIDFDREVMPVLSSAGCSDIRCHGAPSGKNGFRLSLWGFDPSLDYMQLTRDAFGRRTNRLQPSQSLILMKALARVPHAGGRRFPAASRYAQVLHEWQAQGLQRNVQSAPLKLLKVTPRRRVVLEPAKTQQISVRALFEDQVERDVTRLTSFSSTDRSVAEVDRQGLVRLKRQGDVVILCRYQGRLETVRLLHVALPPTGFRWSAPPPRNAIDRHVFAKLKQLHIQPAPACGDAQFIRRVNLDLCGVLPTPQEVRSFRASTDTDKRARLVDRLLQRPEYADYWTKKWLDVLRVSRDSIQLKGARSYHRWLRSRLEADVPLSQIVRDWIVSEGASYAQPATNFFCAAPTPQKITDPHYLQKDWAEATAQLFLGVRLQCAKCHNHPYERWTQGDYLGLAAFFAPLKRSRLGKAGPKGRPDRRQLAVAVDFAQKPLTDDGGQPVTPRLPGRSALVELAPRQDPRRVLADWLLDPDNRFFARAMANRVWFHLLGRGIVEPVDDFRDSNPAANDGLLDEIARSLIADDYRLKPLIRRIVLSHTYQASAKTNDSNRGDTRYFSHRLPRPLPAEVLLDAICDVTGVPETYEIMEDYISGIPKAAIRLPPETRAVQLPVTDIMTLINTSGRYVRYELHPFLRKFGQPSRTQTCECDREPSFGRKQALELIIGPLVSRKLSDPGNRLSRLLAEPRQPREILEKLYVRALSRPPSPAARQRLLAYVADSSDKRKAWEDILWALINSKEFVYQH